MEIEDLGEDLEEDAYLVETGTRSSTVDPADLTPGETMERIMDRVNADRDNAGEP